MAFEEELNTYLAYAQLLYRKGFKEFSGEIETYAEGIKRALESIDKRSRIYNEASHVYKELARRTSEKKEIDAFSLNLPIILELLDTGLLLYTKGYKSPMTESLAETAVKLSYTAINEGKIDVVDYAYNEAAKIVESFRKDALEYVSTKKDSLYRSLKEKMELIYFIMSQRE